MGCANITYDAPLKKYLMCVTDGRITVSYFNTYILESDRVTGPWKLVSYFADFGEQGYFVNIPSKFISADGRTLWLCYSANFSPSLTGIKLMELRSGAAMACACKRSICSHPEHPMQRPLLVGPAKLYLNGGPI
jgi:hypothetical protein